MPDLIAQSATFRAGKYTFTGFVSTPPQTVVLAGTITAVPTYPTTTLSYTLTSGASADALGDLLVNFYSSGGTKKATLRIAIGTASTNTVLQVAEFAQGVYDVAVNDTFQVVKVWNIWDRLVSATAALNKDSRIVYTDQGSNPPPICNSGGAYAGFGTSVDFHGADSFAVDPDSGGTITHAWDFGDGSPSTSTSTNPTGIVFPVGFRWVKHTATDASNSKSTIQYVPVWVHDYASSKPLAVQMDNLAASVEQGWHCNFKLPKGSEGSLTSLPDGSLIVYWEVERYNTSQASYGSNVSGRSTIKFVGYLVSDSIHIDPDSNEVTFEAVSPLAILEQTPALPQLMVSKTSPAKWSEIKTLSTRRALWYLSYWHSSLMDAFDFIWIDGLDTTYDRLATEADSLAGQLRDIASGLTIQVTCDRLGRVLTTKNPDYMSASDRNSLRTKTYDLTTADVMEIDIPRNHRGSTKFVRGEGVASGNIAVFSNAPGNAPAPFAPATDTLARQIVSNQSDLNNRTGWHFARVNGLYNGQFVPQDARLVLPDGYDVFDPAYREFVTLTLASALNSRAVGFDNTTKWTVEGVNINYDLEAGTKQIEITLDHETIGPAAVSYIPPQTGQSGLSDFPPLDTTFPTTDLGHVSGGLVKGTTTLAVFAYDGKVYITTNFENPEATGGPTYVAVDLTALSGWGGSNLLDFTVDAFSPLYLGTGSTVNGWILGRSHVQKITDIFGSPSLGTFKDLLAVFNGRSMNFERSVHNWGIVASWEATNGVIVHYTTDGDTWTRVVVNTFYDSSPATWDGYRPGLNISPHTAGKAYISAFTSTGSGAGSHHTADGFVTTDYGANWAAISNPDIDPLYYPCQSIVVPYTNTADSTVFYGRYGESGGDSVAHLYRAVATVKTDISPVVSAVTYGPISNRSIAIPDGDPNTLLLIGHQTYAAGMKIGVFLTHNANAATPTWQTIVAPDTTVVWRHAYALGSNTFILLGTDGNIAVLNNGVIDSRVGNLPAAAGLLAGVCGG